MSALVPSPPTLEQLTINGLRVPMVEEADLPPGAPAGTLFWVTDVDDGTLYVSDGTAWAPLSGGGGGLVEPLTLEEPLTLQGDDGNSNSLLLEAGRYISWNSDAAYIGESGLEFPDGQASLDTVVANAVTAAAVTAGEVRSGSLLPAASGGTVAVGDAGHLSVAGNASANAFVSALHTAASGFATWLRGRIADAAAAVAVVIESGNTLAAAGSKLISIRNNGTEKAAFDKDGGLTISGVASGADALIATAGALLRADQLRSVGTGSLALKGNQPDNSSAVNVLVDSVTLLTSGQARLFTVKNAGNECFWVSGDGSARTPSIFSSSSALQLKGGANNGSTAIGVRTNTENLFSTAGSKILSVQNASQEKAFFDKDGGLTLSGVASGADALTFVPGARISFGYGQFMNAESNGSIFASSHLGVGGSCSSNQFYPRTWGNKANISGSMSDTAAAIGVTIRNEGAFTVNGAVIAEFCNYLTRKAAIHHDGKILQDAGDSTASPGAATVNKPVGKSAIASGATSVVITNATVTTSSLVHITPRQLDAAVKAWAVAVVAGSFTLTLDAAPGAAWAFNWSVTN